MARIAAQTAVVQLVHDGKVYRPDGKGIFHVPDAAVEQLLPHGFVRIGEEAGKQGIAKPPQGGRSQGHGGR